MKRLKIEKLFDGYQPAQVSSKHALLRCQLAHAYRLGRLAAKSPADKTWLIKKLGKLITGRNSDLFLPIVKHVLSDQGKSAQSQYAKLLQAADKKKTDSKTFEVELNRRGADKLKRQYLPSRAVPQKVSAARKFIKNERRHTIDCPLELDLQGRFIALGSLDLTKGKMHLAVLEPCDNSTLEALLKAPGFSKRSWALTSPKRRR